LTDSSDVNDTCKRPITNIKSRRGFTIRLKRLKPRAPDFWGPKRTISSNFVSDYVCIFALVQRTFFSQTVCNGRDNFRIDVFTILIDQLESDLEFRYNAYKNTCDTFGESGKLRDGHDKELIAGSKKLTELCNEDLEPSPF